MTTTNASPPLAQSAPVARLFQVQPNFSSQANILRRQFEAELNAQAGGMSCFTYAFCRSTYAFLTANAEQLFARAELDALLDEIAEWGAQALGTSYVSTPQVRVYIDGCSRTFARDEVDARWHYLLWLTRFPVETKARGRIRLITDNGAGLYSVMVHRTADLEPKYNDLVVHDTMCTYSVEPSHLSMDPSEALVFLDGYLW
jgi:hypothetical protein